MWWAAFLALLALQSPAVEPVPATSAGIGLVQAVSVARSGEVYLASRGSGRQALLLGLSPDGRLQVVGPGSSPSSWRITGRLPHEAPFDAPVAVVEQDGAVYVLDQNGSLVRLDPASRSVVARSLAGKLLRPRAMVGGGGDAFFISDEGSHAAFRYDAQLGELTRVAGVGLDGFAGDGGAAESAWLARPRGLALGSDGSLYVADRDNGRVRRVDSNGMISSVRVEGEPLVRPESLALLADGSILVVDTARRQVVRLDRSGRSSALAGLDAANPTAVAAAHDGSVFVFDADRLQLLKWRGGRTAVVAGNGGAGYCGDGGPALAADVRPRRVLADARGTLYFADADHNRVRTIDGNGVVRTVAGNGVAGFAGDGEVGPRGSLSRPMAIAWDPNGAVLIADADNHRIRRLAGGVLSTAFGSGRQGSSGDGGKAAEAAFDTPTDIAVDTQGNVFVAHARARVRRIDGRTLVVSTVVGGDGPGEIAEGQPPTGGRLGRIMALAVDAEGRLVIAEAGESGVSRFRRFDPREETLSTIRGGETLRQVTGLEVVGGGRALLIADMEHGLVELELATGEWTKRGGTGPVPAADGRLAADARFVPLGVTSLADGRRLVSVVDALFSIGTDGRLTKLAGGGAGF